MLITAEDLHAAADKVGVDAVEEEHGVKEDAVYEFYDGSVFDNYTNMDGTSLAFGILIGVRAALDKDLEWLRSKLTDENYLRDERMVVIKLIEEFKHTKSKENN